MKPKLILSALALLAVLLSACSPSATATIAPTTQPTAEVTAEATTESTAEVSELSGSAWQLTTINGQVLSDAIQISLNFDDALLNGVACNSYSGPYTASAGKIQVGQVVSTLKACLEPLGLMDQETAFLAALGKATTYERTAEQLTIGTDTNPSVLIFKPDVHASS